jgi:hypothetical protein
VRKTFGGVFHGLLFAISPLLVQLLDQVVDHGTHAHREAQAADLLVVQLDGRVDRGLQVRERDALVEDLNEVDRLHAIQG